MKKYIKPEIEIIELSMQDCITASSVYGGWDEDGDGLVDEEE